MATKKEEKVTAVTENSAEVTENSANESIEIPKAQLDEILKNYEDMKNQVALLTKQTAENSSRIDLKSMKLEEERQLLALVKQANAEGEELVEVHIDSGAIRSNKNAEVSINGIQTIIPKGQTVKIKRSLKEIIDNSEKQKNIALGLQEERNTEYKTAEAQGAFNA